MLNSYNVTEPNSNSCVAVAHNTATAGATPSMEKAKTTAESVGIKIRRRGRQNFRGVGRNDAAETLRVGAAAERICSCGKDFGRRLLARKAEQHHGWAVQYA
jgi:hypothetical protein